MTLLNVYIFIYDEFTLFEVVLASYLINTKFQVKTLGIEKGSVCSFEGLSVFVEYSLDMINANNIGALIIPGGNPGNILNNTRFHNLIRDLNNQNKVIASICSGTLHLIDSGILDNRHYVYDTTEVGPLTSSYITHDGVVVGNNIITSTANSYIDFSITLANKIGVFVDESDYQETVNFFKYGKKS